MTRVKRIRVGGGGLRKVGVKVEIGLKGMNGGALGWCGLVVLCAQEGTDWWGSVKGGLAHPRVLLTTNKAATLVKFLKRKLQDPNGMSSINPQLLELVVNKAKATIF
ncbi:hypothetical protein GOBAR_AA30919 [Gossypium barbadense]|uniref:Uncharacterized protein n=1 Tax=Gossypium barbadense TaxID=3634 RepID=A0A2P5WFE1_GOSBA|nr:hypothetical protein GOBAR_AA30919 [Gossypium barbadense]